jgi:acetyl-CoA carboxylase biotin carboxyl carrier protein
MGRQTTPTIIPAQVGCALSGIIPAVPVPIETVKRCLQLMERYNLQAMEIAVGETRIHIERTETPSAPAVAVVQPSPTPAAETPNWTPIEAPMTGMFYRGPSPSEPPYVEEGDLVHEGQTIGLIEAMKVFNEVPSPTTGIVRRIVAQNATLVQQGEVLMLLEPPE